MTAAYNSDVNVTVEAAFGYDPLATPTWTDITAYVRQFQIQRGRSHVLDQMQAGQATLVLDNRDSRFTPRNTSGAYYPNVRVFTPLRIRAVHNVVTYDLYRGFVTGWPQTYPGIKDAVSVVNCVDAFRLLAMYETEFSENVEDAGTRVGNLLDVAGWPAGWRDIDTGVHTVADLTAEFNSVLGEIQRAELVEQGAFWIAGTGDATFRDGLTRLEDTTIQATFSDDNFDIDYTDINWTLDDGQLWNHAVVTRQNGTAQESTDATSVGDYGQRDLHLSETLNYRDGEALALADWLVLLHSDIRVRVQSVTIIPENQPTNAWPVALGLEIWDKVNVERTPPSSSAIDVGAFVEGIAHDVSMVGGRRWQTTFQLSANMPYADWWVLGTSELGTDTRLAY